MARGSQNMTTYLAKGLEKVLKTDAINVDNLLYINTTDTSITADMLGATTSIAFTRANITGAYTTGHMVWLNAADIGTPFQLVIHDSSDLYFYKRYKNSGTWSEWSKMRAGTADTWTTARTLTIGNTGKSVDGSANVSWSKDEILGASTDAYFLRGDKVWSNTLNSVLLLPKGLKTGARVNDSGAGIAIDTDGGIEIFHTTTPFIDFHYQASTADYSVRLICDSATNLTCIGTFTAKGTITANGGYLQSTLNGNTIQIGSQNGSYGHFTNSKDIPFWFNKVIQSDGGFTIYNTGDNHWRNGYIQINNSGGGDCYIELKRASNADWRMINSGGHLYFQSNWTSAKGSYYNVLQLEYNSGNINILKGNIAISHATSADMAHSSANPKITFSENGTQPVHLIYTDYDNYRGPAGLKVVGGASATPAWFEVEGQVYAARFNGPLTGNVTGNADTVSRATFGDSSHAEHNANNITSNGLYYYTSNGPATSQGAKSTDGALYAQAYSTAWVGQIAQDYRNGYLYVRGKNNNTWTSWLHVLNTDTGVSRYHVGSTANNSYILVTINPQTSWMLNFTLKVYQSYTATDIQISGYNYGSNHWYQPQAVILGSTSTGAIKVYFGYTANYALWVAIDGGDYNGADVVDMCNGYTQIDPANAFTVTKVNSLPGTTQTTITAYRPWYRNETVSNATTSGSCTGNAATTSKLLDSAHSWTATEVYNYMTARVLKAGDTMTGQLYINYDQDVGLNQNGSLIVGPKGGTNIALDGNEIMARNNSAASTLYLNSEGGQVYVGSGGVNVNGQVAATWLRVVNNSSNNSDDAMVYIESKTTNDWAVKINKGGVRYGVFIDSLDQDDALRTNGYIRARCVWANQGSNGERQVGVDSATSGNLYLYAHTTGKGLYSGSGYQTGAVITISSSEKRFFGNVTGNVTGNCSGSSGSCTGHAASDLALSGGVMTGAIQFNSKGNCSIYNGPNDQTAGYNGTLNNLVISSWNGVSFTTSCTGQTCTGKSAVSINCRNGYVYAGRVYNAVWNDYAEYRASSSEEPGRVIIPSTTGIAHLSTERLQSGGRVISDTYGHAVGQSNYANTPVGLSGRVLAYPYKNKNEYKIGDAVCSAPGGTVDIMTRDEIKEYPDRIIGIVNEIPDYDIWEPSREGGGREPIHTNGRIWIDVK